MTSILNPTIYGWWSIENYSMQAKFSKWKWNNELSIIIKCINIKFIKQFEIILPVESRDSLNN